MSAAILHAQPPNYSYLSHAGHLTACIASPPIPPERFTPTTLADAGITEADLQEWIIDDPGFIDVEVLVKIAEYGIFNCRAVITPP